MKKILLLLVLCLNISIVLGQEYKAWEKHDIEGIYIMAKSKDEAKNYNNVLREGADYYIPTEQEDQVLFIRVSKRITPKLYTGFKNSVNMNLLNKFIQRICSISRYGRSSAAGTK